MNLNIRLLFLFILAANTLYAQEVPVGRQVLKQFDEPEKLKWIKHFQGRIDDLNDIALTLAFDGEIYIGKMQYLRSQETFWWEGQEEEGFMQLTERRNGLEDEPCGYIYGQLQDGFLVAEWSNYNNSTAAKILLQEVDAPVEMPSYCGDNKWIAVFSGNYINKAVSLILQNDLNDIIHGTLYLAIEGQTLQLKGEHIDPDGRFSLAMTDDLKRLRGYLAGSYQGQDELLLKWKGAGQETVKLKLHRQQTLPVGCRAYADYLSSYDILYPKTSCRAFNRWINRLVDDWTRSCRQYALQVQQNNPSKQVNLRSSLRANAWCDLEQVSEDIISGYLVFSNTWSVDMEAKAFNFDVKKNKEILMEDVFRQGVDIQKLVRAQVDKKMERHAYHSDPGFQEWIAHQLFRQFTLRKEGIAFSTAYSSVYGRHQVTIPYHILKPYLKEEK